MFSEKELYDVASQGDVAQFQELVQGDPYLVERVSFPCSRNVLHVATLRGQVAIVEEVLKISPQLALDLDSKNSSPLHIAAAIGNVEIAKRLVAVAPEMCWHCDGQGLNPVHIAAVKGHINMLEMLLNMDPLPAMERVHRGQTVLHLCVKHRHIGAFTFLLKKLGDLVHAKDDDGETLLHWAVRSKQELMIDYLVMSNKVDTESTNSMGSTAVEILKESRDAGFTEYVKSKITSGFMSKPKMLEFLSKRRELTMVVMTLIATMAFQGTVSPPGGVWQEDTSSHRAGEAVIATTHPKIYKHLIRANTIAFVSSLITIFLAAIPQRLGNGFLLIFSHYIVCVSLSAIAVSFGGSLLVIAPGTQTRSLTLIIIIVVVVTLSFLGITLLWEAFKQWNRAPNTFEFCVDDIQGRPCSNVLFQGPCLC